MSLSHSYRPLALEPLEACELLAATLAIGQNIERVGDYAADWKCIDAFKESRPWVPELYNTATHVTTQDTGGLLPVSVDGKGWPPLLRQTTNAQGQVLQELGTDLFAGDGEAPSSNLRQPLPGIAELLQP